MPIIQPTLELDDNQLHSLSRNSQATTTAFSLDQVSVSQLLGRDYVFIDIRNNRTLLANTRSFINQIEKIMKNFSLSEGRTLFVTVDANPAGDPEFIRHEIHWHQHHAAHLESIPIDSREQEDFMMMIWQCSTPIEA